MTCHKASGCSYFDASTTSVGGWAAAGAKRLGNSGLRVYMLMSLIKVSSNEIDNEGCRRAAQIAGRGYSTRPAVKLLPERQHHRLRALFSINTVHLSAASRRFPEGRLGAAWK